MDISWQDEGRRRPEGCFPVHIRRRLLQLLSLCLWTLIGCPWSPPEPTQWHCALGPHYRFPDDIQYHNPSSAERGRRYPVCERRICRDPTAWERGRCTRSWRQHGDTLWSWSRRPRPRSWSWTANQLARGYRYQAACDSRLRLIIAM